MGRIKKPLWLEKKKSTLTVDRRQDTKCGRQYQKWHIYPVTSTSSQTQTMWQSSCCFQIQSAVIIHMATRGFLSGGINTAHTTAPNSCFGAYLSTDFSSCFSTCVNWHFNSQQGFNKTSQLFSVIIRHCFDLSWLLSLTDGVTALKGTFLWFKL